MIKTNEDYHNACTFIDSDMELYDFQLSDRMSSYEYNLYLQDTEYFLNYLYEKIRTLEELCDYLDHYIDTKIAAAREEIDRSVADIETVLDAYNQIKTENIVPAWDMVQSKTLRDRDGNRIQAAVQQDGIMAASCQVNPVRPQLLLKDAGNRAYQDNLTTALRDGYYVTCYQLQTGDTVEETVSVILPQDQSFNCIDVQPINCEIDIETNGTGILLHMKPSGYDKEYRAFTYSLYKESGLNTIVKDVDRYTNVETIQNNFSHVRQQLEQEKEKEYLASLRRSRQTENENRHKEDRDGYA